MRISSMQPRLTRFVRNDDGATLLEYALLAALASVIVVIAVMAVTNVTA